MILPSRSFVAFDPLDVDSELDDIIGRWLYMLERTLPWCGSWSHGNQESPGDGWEPLIISWIRPNLALFLRDITKFWLICDPSAAGGMKKQASGKEWLRSWIHETQSQSNYTNTVTLCSQKWPRDRSYFNFFVSSTDFDHKLGDKASRPEIKRHYFRVHRCNLFE